MIKQKLVNEGSLNDHLNDGWLIKMVTPGGSFVLERDERATAPDLKAEDIVKSMSPFDDMDEDDIKYWSTPYYDEIQARKRAHQEKLKEEVEKHG